MVKFSIKLSIFSFISMFLWFRFIRKRYIGEVTFNYTFFQVFIYFVCFCLFLYLLIFTCVLPAYRLLYVTKKSGESQLINNFLKKWLLKIFMTNFGKNIIRCYLFLKNIVIETGEDAWKFCTSNLYWNNFCENIYILSKKRYFFIFYPLFIFLPSLLVAGVFFLENVIFHYIYYFPYVILLMLIPLIIQLLVYFAILTTKKHLKEVKNYITIEKIDHETIGYAWSPKCPLPNDLLMPETLLTYIELNKKYKAMYEFFVILQLIFSKHKTRFIFLGFTLSLWVITFAYLVLKYVSFI